ncbi:hypothetical protein QOZ88_07270 [Blastococcus sp. BMG 814]|uniref:Uncharacterized protein n=1 Tax=Blastococcus carthaginiensis TaxID=3050034 RepID=A0ABT9IA34_9ACTN|nr:hypothetical protein [Blastococcus carthaginiensis]MDP5182435.1 hypothetical protein [Blastococcus carthaginiensis]
MITQTGDDGHVNRDLPESCDVGGLGSRCGAPTGKWLRFDPDFVYRNVTITDARVSDVVDLAAVYSRRLAGAGTPMVNSHA